MNIDEKVLKEQAAKKEEFIKKQNREERQQEERETGSTEPNSAEASASELPPTISATTDDKKKNKKKKKKAKGLASFMEDEKEASAFKQETEVAEEVKAAEPVVVVVEPVLAEKGPTEVPPTPDSVDLTSNATLESEEDTKGETEDITVVTPQKQPHILMREDEHSDRKNVKFDESKNVIKEFSKNERIESLTKKVN